MAIAWRATGTTKKITAGGDLTNIGLPTGHAADDILWAGYVARDNVTPSMAGWTNTLLVTNGVNATYATWVKRDNGAESNPTITHTGGAQAMCHISAFSGVDNTLTVGVGSGAVVRDIQDTTGSTLGSGAVNVSAPALTGVVAGDMRIFDGMWVCNDTSGGTTGNWAIVSGWSERQEAGQVSPWGASIVIDTLLATGSAGSVSTNGNNNGIGATNPLIWGGIQAALSSDVGGAAPAASLVADSRRGYRHRVERRW